MTIQLKHEIEMQIIARKLVLVENTNVFNDEDMRYIRAKAFLSCVESGEVCLSATAVAHLFKHSPTTIRKWRWFRKINCYFDNRNNGSRWPWYEIPLSTVVDLKRTNGNVDETISLDIKKVDF